MKKFRLKKTAIIAKTLKVYEYFRKIFSTSHNNVDIEQIAVIEGVLEYIINEKSDDR